MNTIFKIVNKFIKLCKSNKPEAPKTAPFGEYAWAPKREGTPEEPDNELETKIFKEIRKHFASGHQGLSKKTVDLLVKLMQKGYYKKVLHPPPYKVLYRGLKLTGKELSKLIDKPINEIEDSGFITYSKPIIVPITNGHSTSWSFKKKITNDFSKVGKRGYAVTLFSNIKDNKYRFIAGPGGLYDVEGMSRWHKEKETVGLEPILIYKIEWEKL